MAFQIKICGITTPEDAVLCVDAGADALGLNFYPSSLRYLDPRRARAVAEAIPAGVAKVGLFVNAAEAEIVDAAERLGLDWIQLHGDEPPAFLASLRGYPILRAFRIGADGLPPVVDYLAECRRLECVPARILLDAMVAGQYGGTGALADWPAASQYQRVGGLPSLVLAGGLTSRNVCEAIRAVTPAAVDTASGVEASPGRKDPMAVAAFVAAAREGFRRVAQGL